MPKPTSPKKQAKPAKEPAVKKVPAAKKVPSAKKAAEPKKDPPAKKHYAASLARDPNLDGFEPDFGNFANVGSPEFRARITEVLISAEAVNRVIGSVTAAPSRPPVAAIEQLLVDHGGETVFEKESKKMIGRLIRQIVEHLGGQFVRRGVPITVKSEFKKGSIYKL